MKKSLITSLRLVGEIGFSVSIPLVALGLSGRYLDRIFNTTPYLFLLGIILATVLIYFVIKNIVQKVLKDF